MQSGPFEVDQTTSLNKATPEFQNPTTQHGFQHDRRQASGLPVQEECAEPQDDPSRGLSATLASPAGDGRGASQSELPRLSASESVTTRSETNRIVEADYDDDLIPPSSNLYDDASSSVVNIAPGLSTHSESTSFMDLPNDALAVAIRYPPVKKDDSRKGPATDRTSEKRCFTRLTALASWRSEYIIRTRLLRSLMRGKPAPASEISRSPGTPRSSFDIGGQAAITYSSGLYTTITHLHASFEPTKSKKVPRFILGTDEVGWARRTDVSYGKVDGWGSSDPQTFLQFEERFPGDAMWGLDAGNTVGVPNVMDLSQTFGMVYGEGSPGGLVYFRSTDEMRGRFLAFSKGVSVPHLGIPETDGTVMESICSVWIAKSTGFVAMTAGLFGILSGSSYGIVTAYSLGTDGLRDQRLGRGEITARWVVSPGVPIIGIAVDDQYGPGRQAEKRSCIVVLNALGEVFYLTELPGRRKRDLGTKLDEDGLERLAWETGRTVYWQLIEPTRRLARSDPYNEAKLHASYSPRSSSEEMGLSEEQLIAETNEIENYLRYKPKHFREVCHGWDMKRRLEVDFAGGGVDSRESVIVIDCGHETLKSARIRRFMRCCNIDEESSRDELSGLGYQHEAPTSLTGSSMFSGSGSEITVKPSTYSPVEIPASKTPDSEPTKWISSLESWRVSELSFGTIKAGEIATSSIDTSTYALLMPAEDPLLKMSASSATSSLNGSPTEQASMASSASTMPGQRARFLAVGTKNGTILLWDIRGAKPDNAEIINSLPPVRVIHTDSPQISCLALTALYLVHGGNDGLVQAWDPLASSNLPIRTLNSRFSSRARRRLVQSQSSNEQGIGVNLFAAGAICLDPDPTVLRGMVSLGAHLRYWSYNSSAASQYANSRKRRLRRSERRSNNSSGGTTFSGTGRGALKDYIDNERLELQLEKDRKKKEASLLAGRFGVGLLGQGANDEEMMAYAKWLSEESFAHDKEKRKVETDGMRGGDSQVVLSSSSSSETITPEGSTVQDDCVDEDLAEALQRSLTDSVGNPENNIPTKYIRRNQRSSSSSTASMFKFTTVGGPSSLSSSSSHFQRRITYPDDEDLDFALQLSLAEEESRKAAMAASSMKQESEDDFPALESSHGYGVAKMSASGGSNDGNGESSKKEEGNGNGKGKGKRRAG
ncbi:MAG: hypothetical protein M1816_005511 [Peltula sp. TS41687]|nr:MAG: hypothetical protein M1816_005511 [Peltula sp. TS41687]